MSQRCNYFIHTIGLYIIYTMSTIKCSIFDESFSKHCTRIDLLQNKVICIPQSKVNLYNGRACKSFQAASIFNPVC